MNTLSPVTEVDEDLPELPRSISVVDSHTEGEPTRVIVGGWPEPRGRTMHELRDDMEARFSFLRRAAICEPRGHEA
ncbi:MAG TPA: proline racemase family protein, partial [Longimicrobiaceae bacterium]|nr:proline racemase family protein [Longimicrobiaceae bacterium]